MGLEVFSDMSERVDYNLPGFPLYARKGELRTFDHHTAACHWHPDPEFILVLNGAMNYFVNGQTLRINTGEGIFINSKRLHYGYSKENTDCTFLVVVIHPSLLGEGTHIGKAYIESKFGSDTEDFVRLTDSVGWQGEALKSIGLIYDEMYSETHNPLRLLSQSTALCACICENIQNTSAQYSDERAWLAVWSMTGYIQKNYDEKITLDDIAAAGSVCRSRCCWLFNKYVGQTPTAYLTRYRIGKSCDMLRESDMSVIEVSLACGFQSPSYFTQIFHKETGLTPRDYRNNGRLNVE